MNNKLKILILPCLLVLSHSAMADFSEQDQNINDKNSQLRLMEGASMAGLWNSITDFFSKSGEGVVEICKDIKDKFPDSFQTTGQKHILT